MGEAGVCHCGSMGLQEGLIFTTATPAFGTSLEPAMAQMHKLSLAWSIFFNIKFTMHDIEEAALNGALPGALWYCTFRYFQEIYPSCSV